MSEYHCVIRIKKDGEVLVEEDFSTDFPELIVAEFGILKNRMIKNMTEAMVKMKTPVVES